MNEDIMPCKLKDEIIESQILKLDLRLKEVESFIKTLKTERLLLKWEQEM